MAANTATIANAACFEPSRPETATPSAAAYRNLVMATIGFALTFWAWNLIAPMSGDYKDRLGLSSFPVARPAASDAADVAPALAGVDLEHVTLGDVERNRGTGGRGRLRGAAGAEDPHLLPRCREPRFRRHPPPVARDLRRRCDDGARARLGALLTAFTEGHDTVALRAAAALAHDS